MRAEPCEKRQLLTTDQNIDRVDLNDAHLFDELAQMAAINTTGGPGVIEPLRPQRNPASLSVRELSHQAIIAQLQCPPPFQLGSDPN